MKSYSDSYKAAGVDVTAGYESVELMKEHVKRTVIPGVVSGIGGFGGLFAPDLSGMEEPVLVSGTDGVGTKLKIAMLLDKHDTIGIDAVAMCVNDVVCCGARPLFFLDYIACGKNFPEKIAQIVAGVAEGCVQSGCALIGGETAEHPGMMPEEDYDLAGFTVGIVDKKKIIDGSRLEAGDVLIGSNPPASTPTGSPWCARSSASALMTRPTRPSWPRALRGAGAPPWGRPCSPPPAFTSSPCWRPWKRRMSRLCPTSPAAGSMRTSPA